MNKPLIWKLRGVWYCGRQLSHVSRVPLAPLYGDGSTPALAFADWQAQTDKLREFQSLVRERSAGDYFELVEKQPEQPSGWGRFFRRKSQ